MYRSKNQISTKNKVALEKMLSNFLESNNKVYCRALKKKIFLDKLPGAILGRQSSASQRLKRFAISIEILKHESTYTEKVIEGKRCFEILGCDKDNSNIRIHLREEIAIGKDKKIFYISCF